MDHVQVPSQRPSPRMVSIAGELDLAAKEELRAAVDFPRESLLLDLSAVTFLDASALGVLAAAAVLAKESGGALRICGAPPNVETVLRLVRFHELLAETVAG
jgi:anti-anti-sigma factor